MPQDWFTVQQLASDTYCISEEKHWEQTHCYLLLGRERALLVDTGLGVGDIRRVVRQLTSLPVQVAATHAHWDHIGGHGAFEDIAVHPAEASWLIGQFPLPMAVVRASLLREPCSFPEGFEPQSYQVYQGGASRLLRDGDVLELGGRRVWALHTPGHSPGHLCFWEPQRGWLYSGDLVYAGCLYAFYPTTDPVAFAASAQRVAGLPVRQIWPGHHSLQIAPTLARSVAAAFAQLRAQDMLYQGAGTFDFDAFQIQI